MQAANPKKTLHIFARTRNAPHVFYYRHYAVNEQNWYPWVKVDTDIPSYDVEAPAPNGGTVVTENGSYAIPVVWQNRPLVFAPQFLRKTAPRPIASGVSFKTVGEGDANAQQSFVYWEIKMGWSEYRDGKWTQRQLATKPVYETTPTSVLPDISSYEFVPRLVSGDGVFIDVYQDAAAFGAFKFTGSQLFAVAPHVTTRDVPNANFHYVQTQIHSMQGVNSDKPLFAEKRPFFDVEPSQVTFKGGELDVAEPDVAAYHRFAHELLGTLNGESLDPLFDYYLNNLPTELYKSDAYGRYTTNDGVSLYHELKAPYALYNWEAVFHTPMLLADRLLTARQFDATLEMLHHILNPFAKGTAADPIWRFTPFGEINPADDLEDANAA